MGLTETSLRHLRMANLKLKILIVVIICVSLQIAVHHLGLNVVFSETVFLPIHTNIEFFCVFVALCTFTVTWYSYLNNCTYYSYFIGLGLLAVGFIDLFHFYTYEGMPQIFTKACANRSTLFHLFGRFIMASTFLASIFLYKREFCTSKNSLRFYLLAATLTTLGVILTTVSLYPGMFPDMYVDGQGLTFAKVICEYVIISILAAAAIGYIWLYKKHLDGYLQLIVCTLIISIFSEICLASYSNIYDTINLLGHSFRFASYVLIYIAIFLNNVKRPYEQLVAARECLEKTNDMLEVKVRERTRELQEANEILSKAATHDYLTGAINRMEFSRRFNQTIEEPEADTVHSVMAIDFDSFKKINDTYGHAVGDECLKTFVRVASEVIRPTDTVARFGGDEFMLLLPQTPRKGARVVGEKIRRHLAEMADPPFTISMGIAEWPIDGRKEKDLLAHADEALYLAKEKGKNTVV